MNDFSKYGTPCICLARHGETELTAARCYNGVRDIPLTAKGEQDAARLAPVLSRVTWDLVISSPLQRAIRTAALAGFPSPRIVPTLREFDYGDYEGKTTRQILDERPDWDFWQHGCPNGETPESAGTRLLPLVEELRLETGRVLVFSHSHAIRIFSAVWLKLRPAQASMFEYGPAHLSALGSHRGYPTILLWNDAAHLGS
jgi:broad specificity phosphatase PhoE